MLLSLLDGTEYVFQGGEEEKSDPEKWSCGKDGYYVACDPVHSLLSFSLAVPTERVDRPRDASGTSVSADHRIRSGQFNSNAWRFIWGWKVSKSSEKQRARCCSSAIPYSVSFPTHLISSTPPLFSPSPVSSVA